MDRALIATGRLNLWALSLGFGSVILLIFRICAYRYGIDSSATIVTRFERMVALIAVVVLPWPKIVVALYFLVTIGTFISCLQIWKKILGQLKKGRVIKERAGSKSL